jgi:hypothetical protein
MDRDPGGLIQNNQIFVLKKDSRLNPLSKCIDWNDRRLPFSRSNRGDSKTIALFKTVMRLDPPSVSPHFAGAENSVDETFRGTLEESDEEVIDALAGMACINFHPLNGRRL